MKNTEVIPRIKGDPNKPIDDTEKETVDKREDQTLKTDQAGKEITSKNESLDSQYTIIERIGDGGMGVVYLAKDHKLGRYVAIKRLTSSALKSKSMKQRFFQEAKAVAALTHTNIVHIYALSEDHEGPFIVMEYVPGPPDRSPDKTPPAPFGLADKIHRDGPLPLEDTLELIIKLCRAMEYAHGKGVIHRDLKPSNILLDTRNEPKIVDFGLARQADKHDNKLTVPGEKMLSVGYGAPEQEQDATLTDERADVYGLGALLYFCLTGQNPRYFRQNDVPHEIQRPLVKALATKKEERWPNVKEFATSLISIQDLSSVEIPNIKTTWRCKWCDTLNPVTVQFCGECGWDGGTSCLECSVDTRVGIQFCGNCGADAKEYEQANTLLKRLQRHLKEKNFAYVARHAERSARFRPVGPHGRQVITDILDLRQTANKSEERIRILREFIPQEVSSQNYERAINYIQEYDSLTEDRQFALTTNKLNTLKVERDTKRARKAVTRGDWRYAVRMCKDVMRQNPEDKHEIQQIFRSIRLHRTGTTIRNIVFGITILTLIYLLSAAPVFKMLEHKRNASFNSVYTMHDLLHKATFLRTPLEKYAKMWDSTALFRYYRQTDIDGFDENPPTVPSNSPLLDRVASLKTPFERDIIKIKLIHNQNVNKWPVEYTKSLTDLQQKMQKDGDFEGWEAVKSEIQWFKEDPNITDETIVYDPQELRNLQLKYQKLLSQYEIDKSKKLIERSEKYIKQLTDMQKNFTKKGKMEAASAINAEIKQAKEGTDLMNAKSIMSAYGTDNSN